MFRYFWNLRWSLSSLRRNSLNTLCCLETYFYVLRYVSLDCQPPVTVQTTIMFLIYIKTNIQRQRCEHDIYRNPDPDMRQSRSDVFACTTRFNVWDFSMSSSFPRSSPQLRGLWLAWHCTVQPEWQQGKLLFAPSRVNLLVRRIKGARVWYLSIWTHTSENGQPWLELYHPQRKSLLFANLHLATCGAFIGHTHICLIGHRIKVCCTWCVH